MSKVALSKVREAGVYIRTAKVAKMLNCSPDYVVKNKDRFDFRRVGTRNLEFELSSVLEFGQRKDFKLVS